jgi:hypothetical protein
MDIKDVRVGNKIHSEKIIQKNKENIWIVKKYVLLSHPHSDNGIAKR